VTFTTRASGSVTSVVPSGSLKSLDGHVDAGRDVGGLGLDRQGVQVGRHEGVRCCLADQVHADLDGDLLAAADDHEVDVLEEALDRVPLDVLRQRQLVLAVDVQREQDVRGLQGEHQLVAGQRDVPRVGAVAVQNCGHFLVTADAARGALAELGARLGGDTDLGHGWGTPRDDEQVRWSGVRGESRGLARPRPPRRSRRPKGFPRRATTEV
jgi:hypothetical protein